jgi:hypothetical protein
MDSKFMRPQKYFLLGPASWKGRKLSNILETGRMVDFYESDQITMCYLKEFCQDKYIGRQRIFANNNDMLIKLIQSGVGFGTLTEALARPYVESGKLIALKIGLVL